jgi:parallel beta-helix repeat protein
MSGNTVFVDSSNTGSEDGTLEHPYNTIQRGVNAASVGEPVQVASGTYYENVVINKSLTLKGAGRDTTIIDGSELSKTVVEITADNVSINGFTIRNGGDGIDLYMCNGITVSGNTITSNKFEGIAIEDSNDNLISNNTVTNNTFWGISLFSSDNNTISDNTVTSHNQWFGISLENSQNITINRNILSNNSGGVELVTSSGCVISGNILLNNEVGVELWISGGNSFFHNNFINNTDQVVSSNSAGLWNNSYPSGGNYWSDYEGNDTYSGPFQNITGNDGIGDVPYNSTEYEKDYYPLMIPYDETNPIADAGSDQLVVKGTTVTFDGSGSTDNLDSLGYGIVNYTWSFTDVSPQILTGVQANYTFNNVDNFSVTLNASDYSGNWDTDMMWVNVTWTATIRDIAIANITVSPTTVTTGDTVLIEVIVVNKGDFSENFGVTVYYDSSVVGEKNVTSLASGTNETLSFNWNTMGVPGGDYTIEIVATIVAGETNTTDNTRTYGTVTIIKLTSTISISTFPANITVGDSIILNGSISPVRVEANVTINYRLLGETWNTLTTLTTDADAHYSYNWTPATTGAYEVKASWEGDLTHLPDESDVQTVTVEEAERLSPREPTTNLYLYIAAAAVIILIAAAVVYVMRVRKRKPPSIKEMDDKEKLKKVKT